MQIDQAVDRMREQIRSIDELHLPPVENHRHRECAEHAFIGGVDRECSCKPRASRVTGPESCRIRPERGERMQRARPSFGFDRRGPFRFPIRSGLVGFGQFPCASGVMDPASPGRDGAPQWDSNPLVRIRKDLKSKDFKRSRYRVIRPVAPVRAEATTRVTAPARPKRLTSAAFSCIWEGGCPMWRGRRGAAGLPSLGVTQPCRTKITYAYFC